MKIVVLAGGISTERDVSLSSGSMIYKALKQKGHEAVLLDVYLGYEGETNDIFTRDVDWTANVTAVSEDKPDLEAIKAMRPDGDKVFFGPQVIEICKQADVVFLALHGICGEDGRIQAALELMGIPYTGTDFTSAAMAMDKAITKDLMRAWQIPTPAGCTITAKPLPGRGPMDAKTPEEAKSVVPYPCIVKTCNGGSSVGVVIARNDEEYEAACREAFRYDDEAVVEQFIVGREFSVGVIDGKALPVIEIAPKTGFYDYKNKYQAGSTVETCPARLTEEQTRQIQNIAEQVFRALRYRSYARMDFMMDEKGEFYCLEANTLPGMTPTSLLPQEAAAVGISFEDLCELIIKMALA